MSTPTQDEVKLAVALLWEIGEDRDRCQLRRIAGLIERQAAEIERLRKRTEPNVQVNAA